MGDAAEDSTVAVPSKSLADIEAPKSKTMDYEEELVGLNVRVSFPCSVGE